MSTMPGAKGKAEPDSKLTATADERIASYFRQRSQEFRDLEDMHQKVSPLIISNNHQA